MNKFKSIFMKFNICIILFTILNFCSCKKAEDLRFTKTWYDTEYIIPGKTYLIINKNFTFNYNSSGCQWETFSRGKWKIIGDTIELHSTKIDTCYNIFPFAHCIKFVEYNNKKIETTIPNCNVKSDKDYTLFKKEKFYLKNDSLVYKQKRNSNCPDSLKIIFAKTEKKKKNGY